MNKENYSLQEAITYMLNSYFQEEINKAKNISEQILLVSPQSEIAIYVKALCIYRLGQKGPAKQLMKKLSEKEAALNKYDFIYPLLVQQGKDGWDQRYHARLKQYVHFSQIDGFIISYPKSGRTWLRLMIGVYLLKQVKTEATELYYLTREKTEWPTVEVSHDDFPMWKPFNSIVENKDAYSKKRVIFLVRDPRDTIVSFYFQYTKRGDKDLANDSQFNGSMSDFIRHNIGGLPSIVRFLNIWAQQRNVVAGFQICFYEDLHANPTAELTRVLNFLGWENPDAQHVKNAVRECEFSQMKKIEKTNSLNNVRLKPPTDKDPEGYKVRKGKVGGYEEYFSDEDIQWVNDYLNNHLDDYFSRYKNLI